MKSTHGQEYGGRGTVLDGNSLLKCRAQVVRRTGVGCCLGTKCVVNCSRSVLSATCMGVRQAILILYGYALYFWNKT